MHHRNAVWLKGALFAAGFGIGTAVAMILTPQPGSRTRRDIADRASGAGTFLTSSGHEYLLRGRELYLRGCQLADEAAELFEEGRRLMEQAQAGSASDTAETRA